MNRVAVTVAVSCTVLHALCFLALHIAEPQLSPASSIISDYVSTDSSTLASLSFVVFSVVWLSLGVALSQAPSNWAIAVGRGLFFLASVFILIGVIAPSSVDPRTGTVLSSIQNLFARPGLFLGVLLISIGVRKAPSWTSLSRVLLSLAVAAWLMLVITIGYLLDAGLGGVGQRLVFVVLYVWVVLVSVRLQRSEPHKSPIDAVTKK